MLQFTCVKGLRNSHPAVLMGTPTGWVIFFQYIMYILACYLRGYSQTCSA